MPAGRPSEYKPEIAAFICTRIANGESLRKICLDEDVPASSTIFKWLSQNSDFAEQYTRARESQMEVMAQEIIDIADDSKKDTEFDEEGGARQNTEWINRSRLRVDTRKWLMSKLAPKKYGDKVTHAGDPDNPIAIQYQAKSILDKE